MLRYWRIKCNPQASPSRIDESLAMYAIAEYPLGDIIADLRL